MMTVFRPHPNNVSTCLAAPYTAGSGSLVLDAGTGIKFGSTFPLTVTVIRASTYGTPEEFSVIYSATARSGDTLTISGAIEGTTDHDFVVEDRVDVRWTDGLAKTIEGAVNALETTTVSTNSTYIDPPWITSLAGTKITGAVTSANTAGTITGFITYSQINNLSSWPGSAAIVTAGTIATGTWNASVIAPAKLGTATPGGTNWLRGDGNWSATYGNNAPTISGNTTINGAQTAYLCNAASGPIVITLPLISSVAGAEYIFIRVEATANVVTIQRQGTDTFLGGATSIVLPSGIGKFIRLIPFLAGWFTVGSN